MQKLEKEIIIIYGTYLWIKNKNQKSPNKNIDENIIVCANRYDVDDQDPNYIITGHDTTGNLYTYEKGEEPDRTTFVLGVNEALAYQEFLEKYGNMNPSETPNILTTTKGGWDQNTTHDYYLESIYLEDDYEAFPNGPAEVYCLVVYSNLGNPSGARIDLPTVDNEMTIYDVDKKLITVINEVNQGIFAVYFREWDIFWAWESGTTPDQVVAKVTIDTVVPNYVAEKAFGCNRWDDDLKYGYTPGTDNGHIYNMPECSELAYLKFFRNGFKIRFWESSYIHYYFGMPNATSSYANDAYIRYYSH